MNCSAPELHFTTRFFGSWPQKCRIASGPLLVLGGQAELVVEVAQVSCTLIHSGRWNNNRLLRDHDMPGLVWGMYFYLYSSPGDTWYYFLFKDEDRRNPSGTYVVLVWCTNSSCRERRYTAEKSAGGVAAGVGWNMALNVWASWGVAFTDLVENYHPSWCW